MKVLVIGGAGYIGSHVVLELMNQGHQVTVFDNLSSGLKSNLFAGNGFIKGDILEYKQISKAFAKGFDAAVHLAAFKAAGESMTNPQKYSVNNITGTLNILNAMVEHGCLKLVFSSSAATYGEPKYLPMDENHPTNPENYYGFTKLEIERFLGWYDKLKGLKFAALRYFNAAGYDPDGRVLGLEKNPANLLPATLEAASGMREKLQIFGTDYDTPDGSCIRDYVHVSDLAVGHSKALDYISREKTSLMVNLGSETGISVLEMVNMAKKITGVNFRADIVARRPGDPARIVASSGLAAKLLGWKAEKSDVETLISSTWKVYQANVAKKKK